jgi:hypothetical protein
MQKGVKTIKELPFVAYSPRTVPRGYSVVSAGGNLAAAPGHGPTRASMSMEYITLSGEQAYSLNAKTFTIHEEARDGVSNAPNGCKTAEQVPITDPCQLLGKSAIGEVYYRNEADSPGYLSGYSQFGDTVIEVSSDSLSKDEILKLFDSMVPGVSLDNYGR